MGVGRNWAIVCAAMMVIVAAFCVGRPAVAAPLGATKEDAGDVLVRLKSGPSLGLALSALRLQGAVEALAPEIGIYRLRGSPAAGLAALRANPAVAYVEPNYPTHIAQSPDDPDFPTQWALATINAPAAWDIVTGTNPMTIAIIDTGIDLYHPDLWQKIVPGATFISGTATAQDDHGHGTHVAGIAAASTDNATGIAGVSWGAYLMPVKVLSGSGGGTYAELISGIHYAASHGAQILNMSLDGDSYSQALQDEIDWAYEQGVLLVASAGNCALGGSGCSSVNPVMYPAANNHVISVAATDNQNARASFSTFNGWVDLAAPGVNVWSTWWDQSNFDHSQYTYMSGTSQAAPHVSGLAALVWSARPSLRNADVEAILKNTARDVNGVLMPGPDQYLGWGLIDAHRAVDNTPPQSQLQPLPHAQANLTFTVSWSGSDDNSGLRSYSIQYRDGSGPWIDWLAGTTATAATFTGVAGHTYYFQSSAVDWAANVEPYPGGDGDTHINLSLCTFSGQVFDNRGVSVAGAVVSALPDGGSSLTTDAGRYSVSTARCDSASSITVQRDGFGRTAPMQGLSFGDGVTLTGLNQYLPPVDNLVPDPAWQFENGALAPVWTTTFGANQPVIAAGQGHTGNYAVFLGTPMSTTGPAGQSAIAITVTIPVTMYQPTLSFMYRILTLDNTQHDDFEAFVNGQPLFHDGYQGSDYGTVVHDLGWRHGWLDLSAWAGRQVSVSLSVVQGFAYTSYPTGAYVDEVSLGSAAGGRFQASLPLLVAGY